MCITKDIVDIIQGIVTTGAILVGAIWTYFAFVRNRLRYPRVELHVTVHTSLLSLGCRLVHVDVKISNNGSVLLIPQYAELRLRQVKPVSSEIEAQLQPGFDPIPIGKKELPWPLIVGREWNWKPNDIEIEPGESDIIGADFVIDNTVEVVQLYTFLRNPQKHRVPQGWANTLLYTFSPVSGADVNDR